MPISHIMWCLSDYDAGLPFRIASYGIYGVDNCQDGQRTQHFSTGRATFRDILAA